ncbi:MAG: DUF1848 domain-containing protein [Firmicutes bacterium]|nr:DUF1848 domain-containing protein [Bacillota bacterium]
MLISASRRTDIPAFYGEWFINRVKAGYFDRINPFNPNQVKSFSLRPEEVDAFVFWTKNPRHFFKHLDLIDGMGYNYLFHFTLNDYPMDFEPGVPPISQRIDAFKELSGRIGPKRVVWRYDPVILSSLTPPEYHLEKIAALARELSGYTERLVISFLDFYGKVRRNLNRLTQSKGVKFEDWLDSANSELLEQFAAQVAASVKENGMQTFTCCEAVDLRQSGILPGSCIDGELINEVFGLNKRWKKDPAQRKCCRCAVSVDMGVYGTCRAGCIYCYAAGGGAKTSSPHPLSDQS